jgi:hypothetical protein
MKLWKLEPTKRGEQYVALDCNNGFVIRAESEQDAREIAEAAAGDERSDAVRDGHPGFWIVSKLAKCSELTAEGKAAIVLESFHAA